MGVTRPGSEWWHMKLYTQTPNRLGTPAMLELGGCTRTHNLIAIQAGLIIITCAGGTLDNLTVASTTMMKKACHRIRVVAI